MAELLLWDVMGLWEVLVLLKKMIFIAWQSI